MRKIKVVVLGWISADGWVVHVGREIDWRATPPSANHPCPKQLCTLRNRQCRSRTGASLNGICDEVFLELGHELVEFPEGEERAIQGPGRSRRSQWIARAAKEDSPRWNNGLAREHSCGKIGNRRL